MELGLHATDEGDAEELARRVDGEAHVARHDAYLARRDVHPSELGRHAQRALLRHDEQIAVGVHEGEIDHRRDVLF